MPKPIPDGHEGLIPHLVCTPCADAIEFYKKAFGAEEVHRMPAPDGKRLMHAAVRIEGRFVFLADDFPEYCGGKEQSPKALGGTPVTIHRYVKDCDAAIERAKALFRRRRVGSRASTASGSFIVCAGLKRATSQPSGGRREPATTASSASLEFAVSVRPTLVATSPGFSSLLQV